MDKKNCCDLNLGESLGIFTFFLFSDSGLNLLNGFDFYFDLFLWRDTENHQYLEDMIFILELGIWSKNFVKLAVTLYFLFFSSAKT